MLELVIVLFLLFIDQGTKLLAINKLKPIKSYPLIKGFLELKYVENRGAAFGILQGFRWFFLVITIVFLVIVFNFYRETQSKALRFLLLLITAGAVGNAIDRAFRGYVVDFIYLSIIDFPVFNMADIYLVVGVILFMIAGFIEAGRVTDNDL